MAKILLCLFSIVIFCVVSALDPNEPAGQHLLPDDHQLIVQPEILNDVKNSTEKENTKLGVFEWIQNIFGGGNQGEPDEPLQPSKDCQPCGCGKADTGTRIIGGQVTKENQYPWMCLLQYGGSFYCGCTVISNKYVLTAAHCVYRFVKDNISVRLSIYNRSAKNDSIVMKAKRVIFHESYSTYTYDNDIALIRLDGEMKFENGTKNIRPACMPPVGKSFTGLNGVVIGWGATNSTTGELSQILREVEVPILSNEDCRKTAYGKRRISDNMLCAGHPEGGKDSCQGDSGGPLIVLQEDKQAYAIVGVVSWGEGCAQKNYPGVYARVNRFLTWIRTNAVDSCFCDF